MKNLIAVKEVWYNGRKRMKGDQFEATDIDAKILTATDLTNGPQAKYHDAASQESPRVVNRHALPRVPKPETEASGSVATRSFGPMTAKPTFGDPEKADTAVKPMGTSSGLVPPPMPDDEARRRYYRRRDMKAKE